MFVGLSGTADGRWEPDFDASFFGLGLATKDNSFRFRRLVIEITMSAD